MNRQRFGLIAVVTALVVGGSLLPAQAQPGVALQRQLTENRIREGRGEDILRIPQSDLPLELLASEPDQRVIAPGSGSQVRGSRSLIAFPGADTRIDSVNESTSTLRAITRNLPANSDR